MIVSPLVSINAKGETVKKPIHVRDLKKSSGMRVECWCEKCEGFFTREYRRQTFEYCNPCTRGFINGGKKFPEWCGENNGRWKPNKSAWYRYRYNVHQISKQQNLAVLENFDKPRTLCGVEGGYQLDHIIPIRYGFDNGIPEEVIGHIDNLQIIPWKENNSKRDKLNIQ